MPSEFPESKVLTQDWVIAELLDIFHYFQEDGNTIEELPDEDLGTTAWGTTAIYKTISKRVKKWKLAKHLVLTHDVLV